MCQGLTIPSRQFHVLQGGDFYDMDVCLSVMTDISAIREHLSRKSAVYQKKMSYYETEGIFCASSVPGLILFSTRKRCMSHENESLITMTAKNDIFHTHPTTPINASRFCQDGRMNI